MEEVDVQSTGGRRGGDCREPVPRQVSSLRNFKLSYLEPSEFSLAGVFVASLCRHVG